MKKEHINEIKGIIILALGIILLASLVSFVPEDLSWFTSNPNVPAHNWIRITGAYIAGLSFFIVCNCEPEGRGNLDCFTSPACPVGRFAMTQKFNFFYKHFIFLLLKIQVR